MPYKHGFWHTGHGSHESFIPGLTNTQEVPDQHQDLYPDPAAIVNHPPESFTPITVVNNPLLLATVMALALTELKKA